MYKLRNNFKTSILMAGLIGLCLAIGYMFGGKAALLPAFIIGAAINLFAFFFSDKIALMAVRATKISAQDDPVLWNIVERLSQKAGLLMPRVYISPASAPNAFATGRGPRHSAVCVTAGLREMLSADELEGVLAHELSHIKHRDILISTMVAIVAGAISWLSYLVLWGGNGRDRRGNPLLALLLFVLAPLAATLIQLAISRSREYEADRLGAKFTGSGRPLANALQKLDNANRQIPLRVPDSLCNMLTVAPLTGSDMARLFMTHPPTAERIRRLLDMT